MNFQILQFEKQQPDNDKIEMSKVSYQEFKELLCETLLKWGGISLGTLNAYLRRCIPFGSAVAFSSVEEIFCSCCMPYDKNIDVIECVGCTWM